METDGKDIKWVPGLTFGDKAQVKDAVRSFSIASGRPLKYSVDDQQRIQVVCSKGCPFKMWFSYLKENKCWQLKTVNDEHNCIYQYRNKLVTVKYLADQYGPRIRRNPSWKLKEIQEEFRTTLKVEVGEAKCCRVRQRALSQVEEEMKKHYAGVRNFGGEILRGNKDKTVKICTTRVNEGDAPHFQRFYVCYDKLKKGWKAGCRPIIGLDGCFLKSVCGGQLLSVVGRDGNDNMFPFAMAVGLDKAVREFLPLVEHRFCARHLSSNLSKKHPGEAVKVAFWRACTSTHPAQFKAAMKDLEKHSKGAAQKMNELDPKVWSQAYFATHSKCASTDNNISECFNAWILKTRYMPLTDMLTEIHDMLMERIHKKRDAMRDVDCVLVPKAKKMLDRAVLESSERSVLWDGQDDFQVKWRGVWELTGIPCSHSVCAIQKMREDPVDYVEHWFKKDTYMRTYSFCLEVLRGLPFWEETMGDTVLPPPSVKQLRGRPKRQRRREGWERARGRMKQSQRPNFSRVGRVMHCIICRETGHTRGKYPNKPADYVEKPVRKRMPKRRQMTEEEAERAAEIERVGKERETEEAELMDEILEAEHVVSAPPPTTPRTVFMPTPNVEATHGTGGTPSPSKLQPHEPGTSKRGRPKLPMRKFKVPRKKGL
nr:PREDICTED: uncharacterized protein LOC108218707 [Daucus carota subsp. sativus]